MSHPSQTRKLPVRLKFVLPPPELAPYFSTFYATEVDCGDGPPVADRLHPEWANLRILAGDCLRGAIGEAPLAAIPRVVATGPTSVSTRFEFASGRVWGIGILPLGWLKFVDAPASEYADRSCDACADPAFAAFHALGESLYGAEPDLEAEATRIARHFGALLDRPVRDEATASAVLAALVDGNVASVAELAEAAGMTLRSLERLSRRAFGFPPKLLMRRQRFLRSLAQFMLDPTLSWLRTLDCQYHDQAHFVRDFRRFMTMTPSAYAAMPHPILGAAAFARAQIAGQAVQGLHRAASPEPRG